MPFKIGQHIISFFKTIPFHSFLLPVVFMLWVYLDYSGLIDKDVALTIFLIIVLLITVVFLILFYFFKNALKAGAITTVLSVVYLFFKNIQQSFSGIPVLDMLTHYRVYVPFLAIVVLYLLYKLIKARQLTKITLFLNTLFSIYLIMALWGIARLWAEAAAERRNIIQQFDTGKSNPAVKATQHSYPDIWYIVFDGYPSSAYIRDVLKSDNAGLDTLLEKKGFFLAKHSKSNYNETAFSMAATFSMQYLSWLKETTAQLSSIYYKAASSVEISPVIQYMKAAGYDFYNLSIFDFEGHPSIQKNYFVSGERKSVILYNTLWESYKRDIRWNFYTAQPGHPVIPSDDKESPLNKRGLSYNDVIIDSLIKLSDLTDKRKPRLIYGHVYIPHFPYLYNAAGIPYKDSVYSETIFHDKKRFSEYTAYGGKILVSLVEQLLQNNNQSVIILQSDHGAALALYDDSPKFYRFSNYSAFYFPDKDYTMLYDSISNINTFRVVLNKYLDQQLALLPDSTIDLLK
jgi:hypothetical protein